MRKITSSIVHCSVSDFGTVKIIREWHKLRGFDDIGYHYVILNGRPNKDEYFKFLDGVICPGRPLEIQGAHCRGHNRDSIGICLVGNKTFTDGQFKALMKLQKELEQKFNLALYGHNEFNSHKSCPNFNVHNFLKYQW